MRRHATCVSACPPPLDIPNISVVLQADLEATDRCEFTALHIAASQAQTESVKVLLELGADKEAELNEGDAMQTNGNPNASATPLMICGPKPKFDEIKALLA